MQLSRLIKEAVERGEIRQAIELLEERRREIAALPPDPSEAAAAVAVDRETERVLRQALEEVCRELVHSREVLEKVEVLLGTLSVSEGRGDVGYFC
ncbi:hypothetical protein SAMN00808754_1561 [Thermanaeromonas toyohensis ToBE]|uniref:Uncharacterized protein n=1 Tax=Thermanaeromonas toyohensis ToBE TaxID=698762 RepID=A0A1W1VUR1_9FIRM|nr:hypothetical protein SAMN00808754_1561 [Thermanaeromonas toyohensis ToBE]